MDSASLVVTILSALLASAVLMIFIENQHIAANVGSRYQMIMSPFMHKLSNYFKYISSVRHNFNFSAETSLSELLKKFDAFSSKTVMTGRDYPIGYFSAEQTDDICNDINNVWYLFDKHKMSIGDSCKIELSQQPEIIKTYLREFFPDEKYNELSLKQIADVSARFYVEIYQPIQDYPQQYESWQKRDRQFKWISFGNIIINAAFLIVTLFFGDCICNFVTKSFAVISLILLVFTVWKMVRMEKFSTQMFQ